MENNITPAVKYRTRLRFGQVRWYDRIKLKI